MNILVNGIHRMIAQTGKYMFSCYSWIMDVEESSIKVNQLPSAVFKRYESLIVPIYTPMLSYLSQNSTSVYGNIHNKAVQYYADNIDVQYFNNDIENRYYGPSSGRLYIKSAKILSRYRNVPLYGGSKIPTKGIYMTKEEFLKINPNVLLVD